LPEPRSSPAPHFDGQRALSGGTVQDGVCAREAVLAMSTALIAAANAMHFMVFLPEISIARMSFGSSSMRPQHAAFKVVN
jgi:hypothetical protein